MDLKLNITGQRYHCQRNSTMKGNFFLVNCGLTKNISDFFSFIRIEITVNVNHSVDADLNEGDLNNKADNPPQAEMKSKPHFEVKLIKGKQVTRFACSYVQDAGEPVEDASSKFRA